SPTPNRNVKVINCWLGKSSDISKRPTKWKYLISAIIARYNIYRIKPDIVHAHYATSGGLAAWVAHHPNSVISVHGSDVHKGIESKFWKPLLHRFFVFSKLIHVVSTDLAEKVNSLKVPEKKILNL